MMQWRYLPNMEKTPVSSREVPTLLFRYVKTAATPSYSLTLRESPNWRTWPSAPTEPRLLAPQHRVTSYTEMINSAWPTPPSLTPPESSEAPGFKDELRSAAICVTLAPQETVFQPLSCTPQPAMWQVQTGVVKSPSKTSVRRQGETVSNQEKCSYPSRCHLRHQILAHTIYGSSQETRWILPS